MVDVLLGGGASGHVCQACVQHKHVSVCAYGEREGVGARDQCFTSPCLEVSQTVFLHVLIVCFACVVACLFVCLILCACQVTAATTSTA